MRNNNWSLLRPVVDKYNLILLRRRSVATTWVSEIHWPRLPPLCLWGQCGIGWLWVTLTLFILSLIENRSVPLSPNYYLGSISVLALHIEIHAGSYAAKKDYTGAIWRANRDKRARHLGVASEDSIDHSGTGPSSSQPQQVHPGK